MVLSGENAVLHKYALVNGKLTSIAQAKVLRSSLPAGQRLQIADVLDGHPMILRAGEVRQKHFAFMARYGGETDAHELGKRLLELVLIEAQTGGARPRINNSKRLDALLQAALNTDYTVHVEHPLGGGRRADIALVTNGKVLFVFEVLFTSKTELRAREGFDWAEFLAKEIHEDAYELRAVACSAAPEPIRLPVPERAVLPEAFPPETHKLARPNELMAAPENEPAEASQLIAELEVREAQRLATQAQKALDAERAAELAREAERQCQMAEIARHNQVPRLAAEERNRALWIGAAVTAVVFVGLDVMDAIARQREAQKHPFVRFIQKHPFVRCIRRLLK